MAKAKVVIVADVDAYDAASKQEVTDSIIDYFVVANESVNESKITPTNITISDFKESEDEA